MADRNYFTKPCVRNVFACSKQRCCWLLRNENFWNWFTLDYSVDQEHFPFNANSGLKFRKVHVSNGKVHSGCTDPTQATALLVIVLVRRIQKSGTGDNNFVKWKGTFRSNQPKWEDRSKWTTFKGGPIILRSNRTETVRSIWFQTEISGILGWMESTPNAIETGSMGVTPRAALPLFRSCLRYKDIAQNRGGTPI